MSARIQIVITGTEGVVTLVRIPNRTPVRVVRDTTGRGHALGIRMEKGTHVQYKDGEWKPRTN